MRKIFAALGRWRARYLPGLLLAAGVLAGFGIYSVFMLLAEWINADGKPENRNTQYVLERVGLAGADTGRAGALWISEYFRDGHSMAAFEVNYGDEREALYEQICRTEGWRAAQIPAEDYAAWAKSFFDPASLVRPMDGVVFDAIFYRDRYYERYGEFYENRLMRSSVWDDLPESMGLSEMPYTTDYTVAFYDRESGAFFYYDQTM